MAEFVPRVSNHAGRFRIMIKAPNGENQGAQYIEDGDDCVIKFKTREQAERYLEKYLEQKKRVL